MSRRPPLEAEFGGGLDQYLGKDASWLVRWRMTGRSWATKNWRSDRLISATSVAFAFGTFFLLVVVTYVFW